MRIFIIISIISSFIGLLTTVALIGKPRSTYTRADGILIVTVHVVYIIIGSILVWGH